jgi:hypothetical protein
VLEFVLFVVVVVGVCPLQDVNNMDTNSEEKIAFLSLCFVIFSNVFVKILNCFWFAGGC